VCKAVSRQRLDKHVPVATDTHATIEVLLEMVFYSVRAEGRRTTEASIFQLEGSVEAKEEPLLPVCRRGRIRPP
jgi:hypothetical protein